MCYSLQTRILYFVLTKLSVIECFGLGQAAVDLYFRFVQLALRIIGLMCWLPYRDEMSLCRIKETSVLVLVVVVQHMKI